MNGEQLSSCHLFGTDPQNRQDEDRVDRENQEARMGIPKYLGWMEWFTEHPLGMMPIAFVSTFTEFTAYLPTVEASTMHPGSTEEDLYQLRL